MTKIDLDNQSTFSDNFTRVRMAGESVLHMDTFNALVEATRDQGFSLKEIEDAKKIQANLAKANDPEAEAFYGLIENIVDGHSDQLHQKSMVNMDQMRQNQLPSLSWADHYAPNPNLVERYQTKVLEMQKRLVSNPKMENKKGRVFHQKQVLAQTARLTVREDLPPYAKAGPFARSGDYRAVIRYSNGQGVPFRDKNPDVRAISIKFFPNDVETDLLMTSGPGLIARDIEEFIKLAQVMVEEQAQGEGLKGLIDGGEESIKQQLIANQVHPFEAGRISNTIAGRAVSIPPSPAALQFWSSLVSVGGFAFKPTLVPAADNGSTELSVDPDEEHCLRTDLQGRIDATGLKYTLRLIYFTDDYATPLNDATAAWDDSPAQVDVADLVISPSTAVDGPNEADIIAMPFNPNNGFDGLGITRARDEIYYAGARGRGAAIKSQYRHFFTS